MQHFADIRQLTSAEFQGLLTLARQLQDEYAQEGQNVPVLRGKSLAMVFTKPSLRTRVSFEIGMQHLGGSALYISPAEVGLGTRETAPDVARVLSGYVDGIMARVFGHGHITELMDHASVPIINGLSDLSHPCQALADIYTVQQELGRLSGVKLAFIGDGDNNVCTSLMEATQLVQMEMSVIAPPGYQPDPGLVATMPHVTVADMNQVDAVQAILRDVDVLYTDVWISMGQEAQRATRLRDLAAYQVDAELLGLCHNPEIRVLHCLPAHRGEEITDDAMDGPHSRVFTQAHNRLHVQKSLLAHLLGGVPLPD